ncbi:MAG: SMP-30/gluconolactonase/LRE family protein [Kordiimonadaceae bacterium]|jgi:gluconolactonase|nr:SMP-30/gluconolactonase/LRE family protein [Kordiimonadaceae bacterium]MBT6037461.1 SMP-30/gluconolactonase/LRE family protein [Kordiimonadaceae bacterium]
MTQRIIATLWSKLPQEFYYTGEPTPWVQMTRPGQNLHSFLEGPCFDNHGNMWLVDVPYGRIFKISPDGEWTLHKNYVGEPHSIKQKSDGNFILTDHKNGLLEYDGEDEFKILASDYKGENFKGLSDLTIAPNGDIWFTDSGRTSLSDPTGNVFRYKTDGSLHHVLNNVPYPNGIALSPDGSLVYLSATRANAVWRFLADYPDPVWPMVGTYIQLSGGLGPDGLAAQDNGNLAVAQAQAGRAYVYSIIGDLIATVYLPEGVWSTDVIYQQNKLYIIEAQTGSIYTAEIIGTL